MPVWLWPGWIDSQRARGPEGQRAKYSSLFGPFASHKEKRLYNIEPNVDAINVVCFVRKTKLELLGMLKEGRAQKEKGLGLMLNL